MSDAPAAGSLSVAEVSTTASQARPYLIEEYTTSVCPHCFAEKQRRSDDADVWKDALLVSHGGKVWMRRFCEVHGETESLYEESAEIWRSRKGWSTPTSTMTPDRPGNVKAFPDGYREGLPASHAQHTCILLLNVTERCNYACRACYASAKPPGMPEPPIEYPSIDEMQRTVETVIAREGGKLGVLMLSGGEPTLRADLPEIIERFSKLNIVRIMLNTNGRRIAEDDEFLAMLARNRGKVEIYLQFDGFRGNTYHALRNEDVAAEKLAAIQRLEDAKVFFTLVTTIKRGVNEDELGEIVRLGLTHPHCSGMALQPMFGSGRHPGYDPQDRATPTGTQLRLEEQTGGLLGPKDFIPLPCSHPDCCDITYMIQCGDGQWRSLPQLLGRDELRKWIHVVSNTITFDELSLPVMEMLKSGSLQRVLSEQMKLGTPQLMMDLASMCDCIPGLPAVLGGVWQAVCGIGARLKGGAGKGDVPQDLTPYERVAERTFRITIKQFMDAHTFHSARIRQCCVHTGTFEEDPRRYSFCWRWLFDDASDFPNGRPAYKTNPMQLPQ
ncbi:radical SAM protein [bacterium]|nr:radical SAM protein [bacterium]